MEALPTGPREGEPYREATAGDTERACTTRTRDPGLGRCRSGRALTSHSRWRGRPDSALGRAREVGRAPSRPETRGGRYFSGVATGRGGIAPGRLRASGQVERRGGRGTREGHRGGEGSLRQSARAHTGTTPQAHLCREPHCVGEIPPAYVLRAFRCSRTFRHPE